MSSKCIVCGSPDAPFQAPSQLSPEDQKKVDAYYASFRDENGNPVFHTGHLLPELMELPLYACKEHKAGAT